MDLNIEEKTKIETLSPDLIKLCEKLAAVADALVEEIAQSAGLSEVDTGSPVSNFRKWGRYGWTMLPNEETVFSSDPGDIENANLIMDKSVSQYGEYLLFDKLKEQCGHQKDLLSAIWCFHAQQYKACSLLLFGMIDSKLITCQSFGEKRRYTGGKATDYLNTKLDENYHEFYATRLYQINVIACLKMIFSDTNDFKLNPTVINRHLVAHGMFQNSVSWRDCIQLFLLLYNLTEIIDTLHHDFG